MKAKTSKPRNFVAEFLASKPGEDRIRLAHEIEAQPDSARIVNAIREVIELSKR